MEKGEFKKKFMVHNSPKFEEKLISRQFFAQVLHELLRVLKLRISIVSKHKPPK